MNRLDGKVAFLSGAARGIGGEAAKLMASVGASNSQPTWFERIVPSPRSLFVSSGERGP